MLYTKIMLLLPMSYIKSFAVRLFISGWVIVLLQMPMFAKADTTDALIARYNENYLKIAELLKNDGSFKKAVYFAEDAFQPILTEGDYEDYISGLTLLTLRNKNSLHTSGYHSSDSTNYLLNRALLATICDTISFKLGSTGVTLLPFAYNFQDADGKIDWSDIFVQKLLVTQKGNCRSLTYLYKILADETGTKCWLALAPNHIYIRNYSRRIGWYNTELTSGTFPTDAWIAASAYVSTDAIRSGIYMDTLSNQQSIALCILDLAKGYEIKTHNYYDGFILKCCDLVLQYHAVNPMALLLKAETLKKAYEKQKEENLAEAASTYAEMEKIYITLAKLHYREMPEKMYKEWLTNLSRHRGQFATPKNQSVPKKAALSSKK